MERRGSNGERVWRRGGSGNHNGSACTMTLRSPLARGRWPMGRRCFRALLVAALLLCFPAANKGTLLPSEIMSRHSDISRVSILNCDMWTTDLPSLPHDPHGETPNETATASVGRPRFSGRVRRPEWHRRRRESWDFMFNLLLKFLPAPAPLHPVVPKCYPRLLSPGLDPRTNPPASQRLFDCLIPIDSHQGSPDSWPSLVRIPEIRGWPNDENTVLWFGVRGLGLGFGCRVQGAGIGFRVQSRRM